MTAASLSFVYAVRMTASGTCISARCGTQSWVLIIGYSVERACEPSQVTYTGIGKDVWNMSILEHCILMNSFSLPWNNGLRRLDGQIMSLSPRVPHFLRFSIMSVLFEIYPFCILDLRHSVLDFREAPIQFRRPDLQDGLLHALQLGINVCDQ